MTTVTAHDGSYVSGGDSFAHGSAAHDGCVVARTALAGMISYFSRSWSNRQGTTGEDGALSWLSRELERTRHTDDEPQVTREMLNNIMRKDSPKRSAKLFVELRYADRIVTAMNEQGAFHDGRLRIMPNPRAKKRYQMACCKGIGFQDACAGLPAVSPAADLARSYHEGYREAALTGVVQPF